MEYIRIEPTWQAAETNGSALTTGTKQVISSWGTTERAIVAPNKRASVDM